MFQTHKLSAQLNQQKYPKTSKQYVRTSDSKKFQIIDLVINEKYSMKLASEIVGVKLSTVKYIVRAYKTGKQQFMSKLKTKQKKFPTQKKSQIPENQSPENSISIAVAKEQQENVENESNPQKENFYLYQPNFIDQLQNHFQFQMIHDPNQLWSMNLAWNYNGFFGSFAN